MQTPFQPLFPMRVALTLLLLLAAAPAVGQDAGAFARYGFGARSMAMGGVQAADVSGNASPFHNPALAPFVPGQTLDVTTSRLAFSRTLEGAQVSAPLRPRSGVVAGFLHAGTTDIDGRNDSGYHTGTLAADEYAFFLAFGTRFSEKLSGGLGLRVYRASLPELRATTSLGASLGLALTPSDRLSLALTVDDLFARYRFDASALDGGTVTDRFPTRLRGSAAWNLPEGRGTIGVEGELRVRYASVVGAGGVTDIGGTFDEIAGRDSLRLAGGRLRLGAEVWVAEPLALRAGIDRIGAGSFDDASPSAGFAIRRRLGEVYARLDYAAIFEAAGPPAHVVTLHVEL